ncbi:MAG: FAD-binding oxidoreductase [Candidatus Methanoplasma sp.]|jgi:D-lactate dehydrogenase (cytochrome)|nr:FAD-binding oxidoreductase [Candidatus Methanoplasma sp.]
MLRTRSLDTDSPYVADESKMSGHADALLIPDNEDDVIEAARESYRNGTPLTVSGMRTGMCGGCVPFGGKVLTTEKMNRVIGAGRDDRGFFIRLQPAVTVRELNDVMRRKAYSNLQDVTEGATAELKASGDYFYPVDPTELNSSIGGNISTNASGPRTLKYGPTRNWVRRIRVVLSDGTALDLARGDVKAVERTFRVHMGDGFHTVRLPSYDFNMDVKNSCGLMSRDGMDLVDLFIGSEGTLGIITEADVYVTEWHPLMSNILFFPCDEDAYGFVRGIRASSATPEFLEFLDSGSLNLIRGVRSKDPLFTSMPDLPSYAKSAVLLDLPMDDTLRPSYEAIKMAAEAHGGSLDRCWCGHELKDRERFFGMRHSIPQTVFEYVAGLKRTVPKIHKMATDMAVPLDRSDEMAGLYKSALDSYGLEHVIFGHIGNGHLHVEIILKDMGDLEKAHAAYRELAKKAISLGGSPSAEHGIGKIKKEYVALLYGQKGVDEIRELKRSLDPKMILAPGNMVDP